MQRSCDPIDHGVRDKLDKDKDKDKDNSIGADGKEAIANIRSTIPASLDTHIPPIQRDDWANHLPPSDHVSFFRSVNWSSSTLGPLQSWTILLRIYTFNVMADSSAATLYWGPQRVSIYNEAFIPLAGRTHPSLMGSPFAVSFPELEIPMQQVFQGAASTGRATNVYEQEMFVERNAFTEETYFSGNFNPLRGFAGEVEGFYNSVHEVTKAKINHRRTAMLNDLETPVATDTRRLNSHLMPLLRTNPRDFPMVLLYRCDEDSIPGTTLILLRGSVGIPEGHPLAKELQDLSSNEGIVPHLRKAKAKITSIPVDELFSGVEWQGFGVPSSIVTIIPIIGLDRLFGFLVVGANPRRAIDEDHSQFMRDLSSKVSSISSAILSAEESRLRAERLEKQLADSTKQIRYMAENATVGMAYVFPDGSIQWANPQFYNITGHDREDASQYVLSFLDVYLEEDRPTAIEIWQRLLAGNDTQLSMEVRLKRVFQPPHGDAEPARVLVNSSARIEHGVVKSIMTIITDVSAFRWAELHEARRATQAEEAKRQQEEFIDFVSHELRNPLSAIFQLAETIVTSFPVAEHGTDVTNSELAEAVRSNIDSATTIIMCAKHQKRIVDDVLTLSKLEYTMLSVSPRPLQLRKLAETWMKMFEAQLTSYDINVTIIAHPSILDPKNDWILCDESRVQQIFLNLMTNAIKFTKSEARRELRIEYGVSVSDPKEMFEPDINWAPNQREFEDLTLEPEWGLGQPLFLAFSVTDTGIGMTEEEISKLFGRFEQASARTTIKYGGSGLGLFLSQRLAEKQAGGIGVSSRHGKGSTFAFYIKSRRAEENGVRASTELVRPALPPMPRAVSVQQGMLGQSIPTTDLNKIHVLLVEDNLVNQRVVHKQLVKAGCVVYVANHGVEALEVLRESDAWYQSPDAQTLPFTIDSGALSITSECRDADRKAKVMPVSGTGAKHLDVILMDWEMPIMDGLQCSREIRTLQREGKITRHIEIIATTANAREEQIEMAIASGCDCVMSKPFMVKDLLAKIHERLSRDVGRMSVSRSITDPC